MGDKLRAQLADTQAKAAAAEAAGRLATPKDLAEYVGVPVKTIYEWNHRGSGPKVLKIGRHVRYRWADIHRWVANQERDAPEAA